MPYIARKDERHTKVALFDGRGSANVWVEDGYGRPVTDVVHVVGVHTEREAIAAAFARLAPITEAPRRVIGGRVGNYVAPGSCGCSTPGCGHAGARMGWS